MGNERAIIVALAAAAVAKKNARGQKGDPGESIVGPRGERGLPGKDGRDGKDGIGIPGRDGVNGADGKDGVGVSDVVDLGGGLFRVALTDGTVKEFTAPAGKDGLRGSRGERGLRGEQGARGEKGDKGDKGDVGRQGETGPMPKHQWAGTALRFEKEPGIWGPYVDLKGQKGDPGASRGGIKGGGGGSGGVAVTRVQSGVAINAYKAVTTNASGLLVYASAGMAEHVDQVLGIAKTSATAALQEVEVAESGVVKNDGWNWLPQKPIFLGLNGDLTQSAGVGVFHLQLGYAKTETEIVVRIGRGILRA